RDGLIRVRNIRALNGRFNTSITHAYSIVIGSKHITLNATGGGFLTASKQFRHGATSKSRSNTASNSTKHKSPHLSGWRQDRKSGSAGMPRPISYAVFCLKKKNRCIREHEGTRDADLYLGRRRLAKLVTADVQVGDDV